MKSFVGFGDEAVDNSICIDEAGGVYVVTSKHMLRLAWTGEKLSTELADGAWELPYEAMNPEKAMALGAISRGSGTTRTLMGFGDDPDKLVVIADAAEAGHLVAFWREAIPRVWRRSRARLAAHRRPNPDRDLDPDHRALAERARLRRRRHQRQLSRAISGARPT